MAVWRALGVITLLLLGGFTAGGPARAALVLENSPVYGSNSLVHDTSTGLIWLKLNFSTNLTPADVLAELGPGGQFAGFRYATQEEVASLTTNFFSGNICCNNPIDPVLTADFANLFGPTGVGPDGPLLAGYFGLFADNYTICGNRFFYEISPSLAGVYDQDCGRTILSPASATMGSYLVAVPEPASITLLASGLLAVLARRRKAKTATMRS